MVDPVASEGLGPTAVSRRDLIAFVTAFGVGLAIYITLHVVLKLPQRNRPAITVFRGVASSV